MQFSLKQKLLMLLLAVCLLSLASAILLRTLMVRDFKAATTAREQEHIYQFLGSLEGRYQQHKGWGNRRVVAEELAWALQNGIEARLFEPDGKLVIDTSQALNELPVLMARRIITATAYGNDARAKGPFNSYLLTLNDQEIGWLEARQLHPLEEQRFLTAANRFLLISILILGLLSLALGAFMASHLSGPISVLTTAAEGIANGDLSQRVAVNTKDETGRLASAFNRMADFLEAHERLRRQLVSNAAHELRTPLMIIRGELEGMIDGLLPTTREELQSIHQETSRLTAILDGVDELSRAESSFIDMRLEPVRLDLLFESIITRFARVAEEKQARIVLDCPDGLTVMADPDRLTQVLINLISNSIKAIREHGRIELRGISDSDSSRIEVQDNGQGIPADLLPTIFERFCKGKNGGLGLGLAIVRELVSAHGWEITAASEPGKGALFTITMPAINAGKTA